MKLNRRTKNSKRKKRKAKGLLNNLINKLPVELHLPKYQYCGPGTKFEQRYKAGQRGINELDNGCMYHDKAYTDYTDVENRTKADKELRKVAQKVYKNKSNSLRQRGEAYLVDKVFAVKNKLHW